MNKVLKELISSRIEEINHLLGRENERATELQEELSKKYFYINKLETEKYELEQSAQEDYDSVH
jgi:uncharacterized membrane protein